ncbi:MAG: 23S rRNA (adenine(2503)-C(2))-methyltransferase RlmN [Deltaproteobacteria bacterium]|nr:MAG: 23S rRNA (adenine(2503)-C(2))-methyltransferase RlmN [Deltaproteobacteria bacterium]
MANTDADRTDLKGMTLPELERFFARWGKERYRARQVSRWIYEKHVESFAAMTDLSKEFRALLSESCTISSPPAERVEISADGTEKYLFRLGDGETVESVLIPDEGRRTLCVSSQVGCPLGCVFCATGAMGFRRDMTSAEIVHQVCFAAKRLAERGERLSNVVFMGMGEPLLNVDEVSRAVEILLSQHGFCLSGKRVTVSTAGIVPAMIALAEKFPVSFAVSVNASDDAKRSSLMPVNREYPQKDLVAAMKRIPLRSGRKVTAEYVLLPGVNDSPEDAAALARLFRGGRIKVNLIPFNPHEGTSFRSPDEGRGGADRFRDVLLAAGIQAITRERRGRDIHAACGQLRGSDNIYGNSTRGSGCVAAGGRGSVRGSPCDEPARLRFTSLRPPSCGDAAKLADGGKKS